MTVSRSYLAAAALSAAIAILSCVSAPEQDPRPDLDAAWAALAADDFKEALRLFKSRERGSGGAEAFRGETLAYFAQGKDWEAEQAALQAIMLDPASPRSAVLRDFVSRELPCDDSGVKSRETAFAAMDKPGMPVWSERAALRGRLDSAMLARLNAADLSGAADRMGAVKAWRAIGPYPNPSGNGIDIAFLDETGKDHGPGECAAILPRDAKALEWLKIPNCGPSGLLRPSGYLGGSAHSVHYAEASWEARASGDYWIVLDRFGAAVKLWLDESPIFASAESVTAQDTAWIPVHIEKGAHRFFAKIGSGAAEAAIRLFVRGAPSQAETGGAAAMVAAIPGMDAPDANPLIAQLAAVSSAEKRVEDLFLLAYALPGGGHPLAGAAAVDEAYPAGKGKIPALLAWAAYRARSWAGDVSGARGVLEGSALGSGFAPFDDLRIAQAIECRDWAEAKRRIAASEEGTGHRPSLTILDVLLALGSGDEEAADAYLRCASLPKDAPVLAAAVLARGFGGISAQRLRQDLDHGMSRYAAAVLGYEESLKRENYPAALKDASSILAIDPSRGDVAANAINARLLSRSLGYAGFKEEVAKAARAYPGRAELFLVASSMIRSILNSADRLDKSAAASLRRTDDPLLIEYTDKALKAFPSWYFLRSQLAELRNEEDPEAVYGEFSPFAAIADYERSGAAETGDAVVVRDYSTSIFFDDGGVQRYDFLILKPLSRAAVESESTQVIERPEWTYSFDVRTAFLVKPDGRSVQAELEGNRVSYRGLDVGDYLVLAVAHSGARGQYFKDDFWLGETMNGRYSTASRRLTLVYPDAATPKVAVHGADEAAFARREGASPLAGYKELAFSASDLPAAGAGIAEGDRRDVLAWIDVSTVKDWSRIAAWYRGAAWGATAPNPALERKARELTKGARTRDEAIRALFAFTSSAIFYEDLNFQYSAQIPQSAEEVLEDGFGDCKDKAALLIALLRSVGIEAEFGLSGSDYRGSQDFLPSDRFNHAIVLLPEDSGWKALDPTSAAYTYPELPESLDGTKVLPIASDGEPASLITLDADPAKGSLPGSSWIIALSAETGSYQAAGTAVLRGGEAARLRYAVGSKDDAGNAAVLERYLAAWVPGLRIAKAECDGAAGLLTSPSLRFSGRLDGIVLPSGPGYCLNLPWACGLPRSLLSRAQPGKRQTALIVDEALYQRPLRQTFVLALSQGRVPQGLPKDARFAFKGASARYRYFYSNGSLLVEREVHIPYMRVEPSELGEFQAFLSAALSKQSETVYLVNAGGSR